MTTVFLMAVGFCVYTYVLFPVLLHLLARLREPVRPVIPPVWPRCSIVIAAHNEAARLPAKIASLQALDYPVDRLEVIFVSDGSSDGTVALLEEECARHPLWKTVSYAPAMGKPTALNKGVRAASGEVIIFMDSRQTVSSNAVKVLVAYLNTPDVGAVSGELVLQSDQSTRDAANVGLYWRYEKWIRQNESRLFSTTGATGALYAIRRDEYTDLEPKVLLDDFNTPVRLLLEGKRTLFAPQARAFDQAEANSRAEFRRKVRTLAGNYQSFRWNLALFNPMLNPVWWQFLSHKVFRLLIPYALLIALVSSAVGDTLFLRSMFWLQAAIYLQGLAGLLGVPGTNNPVANFVKVFLQLNAAAVMGALRYLNRSASVRWKST